MEKATELIERLPPRARLLILEYLFLQEPHTALMKEPAYLPLFKSCNLIFLSYHFNELGARLLDLSVPHLHVPHKSKFKGYMAMIRCSCQNSDYKTLPQGHIYLATGWISRFVFVLRVFVLAHQPRLDFCFTLGGPEIMTLPVELQREIVKPFECLSNGLGQKIIFAREWHESVVDSAKIRIQHTIFWSRAIAWEHFDLAIAIRKRADAAFQRGALIAAQEWFHCLHEFLEDVRIKFQDIKDGDDLAYWGTLLHLRAAASMNVQLTSILLEFNETDKGDFSVLNGPGDSGTDEWADLLPKHAAALLHYRGIAHYGRSNGKAALRSFIMGLRFVSGHAGIIKCVEIVSRSSKHQSLAEHRKQLDAMLNTIPRTTWTHETFFIGMEPEHIPLERYILSKLGYSKLWLGKTTPMNVC